MARPLEKPVEAGPSLGAPPSKPSSERRRESPAEIRRRMVHETYIESMKFEERLEDIVLTLDKGEKKGADAVRRLALRADLADREGCPEAVRIPLRKDSANSVFRVVIASDPPIRAIGKTSLGEGRFVRTPEGVEEEGVETRDNPPSGISELTYSIESGVRVPHYRVFDHPNEAEGLNKYLDTHDAFLESVAVRHGIPVEDVPLPKSGPNLEMTKRRGIEAGKSAIREVVVSAFNEVAGLHHGQPTVLRVEPGEEDYAAVQTEIMPTDPKQPLRILTPEDWRKLTSGDISPSLRESMLLADASDFLNFQTDGHIGNIKLDPAGDSVKQYDQGLTHPIGLESPYVSVSMEAVEKWPNRKYPKELILRWKSILTAIKTYRASLEQSGGAAKKLSSVAELGKTLSEFYLNGFKLMVRNEKVAKDMMDEYLARMEAVSTIGQRPPLNQLPFHFSMEGYEAQSMHEGEAPLPEIAMKVHDKPVRYQRSRGSANGNEHSVDAQ